MEKEIRTLAIETSTISGIQVGEEVYSLEDTVAREKLKEHDSQFEKIDNSYLKFDVKVNNLKIKLISVNSYIDISFGQGKQKRYNVKENNLFEIDYNYYGVLTNRTVEILNCDDIVYLDISGQSVQNIYCKNLKKLNKILIYDNNISDCEFLNCQELQYIHMFNNPICTSTSKLEILFKNLCDRNNRAFGSILLFPWSGYDINNAIRQELEKITIPKDWYFGSAIMYDETERKKIPVHMYTTGVLDIWESAEYGSGINIGVYDRAINSTSVEWDETSFNYKKCGGYVNDTLKTWVDSVPEEATTLDFTDAKNTIIADTTESHGYKTLSTLISSGNAIYGITPKSKINYIFYNFNGSTLNNTNNVDETMKIFDKLLTDSDLVYTCVSYVTANDTTGTYYKNKLDTIIENKDKNVFVASGNVGDGDLNTDEEKYGQTYSEKSLVIGGLSASNKSICWRSSENDSVDFSVGSYNLSVVASQTTYINTSGTSFNTPIATGITVLLMLLYEKKYGVKANRTQVLDMLSKRCLPLFDYNIREVGKGALSIMDYNNLYENEITTTSFNVSMPSEIIQYEKFKPIITVEPNNATYIDYKLYCKDNRYAFAKADGYIYPLKAGTFSVRVYLKNSTLYKDISITVKENTDRKYIIKCKDNLIAEYRYNNLIAGGTNWESDIPTNIKFDIDNTVVTIKDNKISCPTTATSTKYGLVLSNMSLEDFTINIKGTYNNFSVVPTDAQYILGFNEGNKGYHIGISLANNINANGETVKYNASSLAFLTSDNYDTNASMSIKSNTSGDIINNPQYADVFYNADEAVLTIKYNHIEKLCELYINGVLIGNAVYDTDNSTITQMYLFYKLIKTDLTDIQIFDKCLSNKEIIDCCRYLLSKTFFNKTIMTSSNSVEEETKVINALSYSSLYSSTISLTKDKYQTINKIKNMSEIVLPELSGWEEINLIIEPTVNVELYMPTNCKIKNLDVFNKNSKYLIKFILEDGVVCGEIKQYEEVNFIDNFKLILAYNKSDNYGIFFLGKIMTNNKDSITEVGALLYPTSMLGTDELTIDTTNVSKTVITAFADETDYSYTMVCSMTMTSTRLDTELSCRFYYKTTIDGEEKVVYSNTESTTVNKLKAEDDLLIVF